MGKQKEKQILTACPYDKIQILEPYLVNAFEKEKNYLLALDIDRLLAGFMETAGFEVKAARYPGWESTEIQGHTIGHYLSAVTQAYVFTGEQIFADRIEAVCSGLEQCQREDGYLFASEEEIFDRLENHQPAWVPWYTLHKILSGLICAYQLSGNQKARKVALKLGDWVYRRTGRWTEDLRREVLAVEYGGMNDVLYELYKISQDDRYLTAARKFDEEELFEKIHSGKDILNNLHANTTIPKMIGAMNRYLVTGEDYYLETAKNFWHMVVEHHTYITGGNSEWEHFGEPDILDAERTACNCETCNVHNMLKLTKLLYMVTRDKSYMDFYERAWMNAVLASQNPETGMTMYFQPMETGFFKVYQEPFENFWCCTGTGMENFTKLQDALYFQSENALYVMRYFSSRFQIADWDLDVKMDVHFPETDRIKIWIEMPENQQREIFFRIPGWTGNRAKLTVDGKEAGTVENGYLKCDLKGKNEVELFFYPQIEAHALPDNRRTVAFTYGPVVLCAGLGKQMMDVTTTGVQVKVPTKKLFIKDYLILKENTPEEWLAQIQNRFVKNGSELSFMLKGTDEDQKIQFVPYFSQYKERYGIYWTLYKKNSNDLRKKGKEREQREKIEDIAIDLIPIGNDQYELAHKIYGSNTEASREYGYNYRSIQGKGSFQYEMDVNPQGCVLAVTYGKYDAGDEFEILIGDRLLVNEKLAENYQDLYTKYYDLTESMLGGNPKATVTFRTLTEHSHCRIFQVLYMCDKIKQKKKEETK